MAKVDMPNEKVIKINYPSNNKSKQPAPVEEKEEKKIEKVVTGVVRKKKRGFIKKATDVFIGEDVGNVGEYILYDVLIPAAKDTLSNLVTGGIEMMLYGETRGHRTYRDKGKSYVNYNAASSSKRPSDSRPQRDRRATHNFDDIVLESKGEAEEVLSNLVDLTLDYDMATVADLYGFVGLTPSFADEKYGWEDLSHAYVSRVRDGYLINLPKPKALD